MISFFKAPLRQQILSSLNLQNKTKIFNQEKYLQLSKQLQQNHRVTEDKNFTRTFKNIYQQKWRNSKVQDTKEDREIFIKWKKYVNNIFKSQKIYNKYGVEQLFYVKQKQGYLQAQLKQITRKNRKIILDFIFSQKLAGKLSSGYFNQLNRPVYLLKYLRLANKLALCKQQVSQNQEQWKQESLQWIYQHYFQQSQPLSPRFQEIQIINNLDLSVSQNNFIFNNFDQLSQKQQLFDRNIEEIEHIETKNIAVKNDNDQNINKIKATKAVDTTDTVKQPQIQIKNIFIPSEDIFEQHILITNRERSYSQSNRSSRSKSI